MLAEYREWPLPAHDHLTKGTCMTNPSLTTPAELRESLRSVVSIPITPFGADGAIDEKTYVALLARLTEGGVTVVTVNGNTGEYYSMSPAERKRLVDLTVANVPESVTVIVGVGLDIDTGHAEAAAAREAGAHCIMVHQPPHPFRSVNGWIEYNSRIAAGAPELGLIPYVKDTKIDAEAIASLAGRSPQLVAVKYAVGDPARIGDVMADLPDLDIVWLCGVAEIWAPFFSIAGAAGFTSGLVTVDPARSLRMQAALERGDLAAAMVEWRSVRAFEQLRARASSEDNVSVIKEALAQLGLSSRVVRPPIAEVSPGVAAQISDILTSWGLAPARDEEVSA